MEQFVINAVSRTQSGKKYAKHLREQGKIPAVAYDEKGESFMLEVDAVEFSKAWKSITKSTLITLKTDGKENKAFIKDCEYDIKSDKPLHADFYIVSGTKKSVFVYKIRYIGTPAGVLKGGYLSKHVPDIKIKALPQDLPEAISADVSKLEIGDKFTIGDFKLGNKIEILSNPASVVVAVVPPKK